ncbi:MAG TPA: hypothetical protein VFT45_14355 [Longimicrobium sp.]|nr:hypothetical protein [Longimicrobium sp.]
MRYFAWMVGLMLSGTAAAPCVPGTFCKCGILTVQEELARSDAVFTGQVLRVGALADDPAVGAHAQTAAGGAVAAVAPPGPAWPVTLRVSRAWKGGHPDSVTVLDAGGCPVGFQQGDSYLVYAIRGDDGVLHTSFCMRTRLLSTVAEDLRVLDGMPPAGR